MSDAVEGRVNGPTRKQVLAGTGLGLGALLAAPSAAQADDFRVTNLNDDGAGSLRQAIADANDHASADRILFKSKLSGTIELAGTGGLYINDDLEIRGPGARKLAVTRSAEGNSLMIAGNTSTSGPIDLTISGLTLTGTESAYNGGAIAAYSDNQPTDLTLSRVTISGNTATGSAGPSDGYGGGVSTKYGGSLVIENSTISGNSAGGIGGGIYTSDTDVSIRNSTISGNSAGGAGGGVYVGDVGADPTIEVRSSTVAHNDAVGQGGGLYEGGVDQTDLRGTIVAGNTGGGAPDLDDLDEGPWSVSFSLIGDAVGAGIDDQGGNLLNVDPKLKPLKNNGGPTDTHAFKKSPVKNKLPKGQTPKRDQRGAPRKGKGDIGAYELVKCEGVVVNRVGTAKKDRLKGTKRKDGILGLGGNDKLSGKKGKDGLCGGRGKDKLKGGPGKDKLDGGPGKDREIQ